MRQGRKRVFACMIAVFLALGTVFTAVTPTVARAGEEDVRAVGSGVFKFNWRYKGEDFSRGSCFLINDSYVLTCWHCAMFNSEERELIKKEAKEKYDKDISTDVKEFLKEFTYSVTIYRDMQKDAELVNYSAEEDWAIFKLKSPVGGSKALKFRDSGTAQAAETVWAVGFPSNSDKDQFVSTYRPDDVTIKQGTVSKPEGAYDATVKHKWYVLGDVYETSFRYKGNYIQTTCPISGGDSGGPMVDDDGNLLGISEMSNENYYFCIANHSIMTALDRLQIEYEVAEPYKLDEAKAGLQQTIDDAEAKAAQTDTYDEESLKALQEPLKAAKELMGLELEHPYNEREYNEKTARIQDGNTALNDAVGRLKVKEKESRKPWSSSEGDSSDGGLDWRIIAAIAAGALALIGAIVGVIIAVRRKKTGELPPTPAPSPAPAPGPGPQPIDNASGDTSVRGVPQGPSASPAPAPVNGGTLARMKTNERFDIDRAEFRVGRESSKVDCVIEGNTNIGRHHCTFIVRGGQTFIVDNHSKNHTFVNNVRLSAGKEQVLQNGDFIRMADEKFRFSK